MTTDVPAVEIEPDLIEPDDIEAYVRGHGWSLAYDISRHMRMYAADDKPSVAVPRGFFGDYGEIVDGVIAALAAALRIPREQVHAELLAIGN